MNVVQQLGDGDRRLWREKKAKMCRIDVNMLTKSKTASLFYLIWKRDSFLDHTSKPWTDVEVEGGRWRARRLLRECGSHCVTTWCGAWCSASHSSLSSSASSPPPDILILSHTLSYSHSATKTWAIWLQASQNEFSAKHAFFFKQKQRNLFLSETHTE